MLRVYCFRSHYHLQTGGGSPDTYSADDGMVMAP